MIITKNLGGTALGPTTATAAKVIKNYTGYNGDGELIKGTALKTANTATMWDITEGKTAYGSNARLITGKYGIPIGGRIFYDAGSNRATYTFYDINGNELTTQTVAGLANAKYYTYTGTVNKDRWYVFDETGYTTGLYYGSYDYNNPCYDQSIGKGKGYYTTVLNRSDTHNSRYMPNLFTHIESLNDSKYRGCSDWYIGTVGEHDALRTSGLTSWYASPISSGYIGACNETNFGTVTVYSYSWYAGDGPGWIYNTFIPGTTGGNRLAAIAFRSF